MRRACVVKTNLPVCFDIDPAAILKTPTRKSDRVRPFAVDSREFQIAVEGCEIYRLPFHDGDNDHPSSQTSVIQITGVEIVWLTRHIAITDRKHIDRNFNPLTTTGGDTGPPVDLDLRNVRFWHKADVSRPSSDVRFWG
jgi:hypothetical protein